MPELYAIQALCPIEGDDPGEVVAAFSDVLKRVGLLTPSVTNIVESIRWSEEDGGFTYSSDQVWVETLVLGVPLTIAPAILGWDPSQTPDGRCWVEPAFLMATQDLETPSPEPLEIDGRFGRPLLRLATLLADICPHFPVALVAETQDTSLITALCGEGEGFWDFLLAVLRADRAWPGGPPPDYLHRVEAEGVSCYLRPDAWAGPWWTK